MGYRKKNLTRFGAVLGGLAVASVMSGCDLPQAGPNKKQIYEGSVERQGDAYIVAVNDDVINATMETPPLGFSEAFKNADLLESDTISPGDVLGLTIWENTDQGLLASAGIHQTPLEEVQVDDTGDIFIPYAGRIRAAGHSPEQIRKLITAELAQQTPDPQVQVRRLAGDGSTVSLIGSVGGQGVYPIERPTRTLATMLARAGGVVIEPEVAQVTVIRGDKKGTIWFESLYDYPDLDIALRGGDRILVEEDTRAFVALGATGTQSRVSFESPTLSALEAIAQVGGLNPDLADPTGIFVMRDESEGISRKVLNRSDLQGEQRMVYVLDLTQPTGLFEARDFMIRDGDTLYVTEAPYAQFTKSISAFLGSANTVSSVTSLKDSF